MEEGGSRFRGSVLGRAKALECWEWSRGSQLGVPIRHTDRALSHEPNPGGVPVNSYAFRIRSLLGM